MSDEGEQIVQVGFDENMEEETGVANDIAGEGMEGGAAEVLIAIKEPHPYPILIPLPHPITTPWRMWQ